MPCVIKHTVIILSVIKLKILILSVVKLNVIMLTAIELSVIMLSVLKLNVIMLSVIMLSVAESFWNIQAVKFLLLHHSDKFCSFTAAIKRASRLIVCHAIVQLSFRNR